MGAWYAGVCIQEPRELMAVVGRHLAVLELADVWV